MSFEARKFPDKENLIGCESIARCFLIQVLHLDKLFDIYPTQETVFEKIGRSVQMGGQESPGQNRLEISEVDWNKNLLRLEYIGGDNVPVRSILKARGEMTWQEALQLQKP